MMDCWLTTKLRTAIRSPEIEFGAQLQARQDHNLKDFSSNLAPATTLTCESPVLEA